MYGTGPTGGLETEWENSDDETFEHVLFSAAEILGIDLLEEVGGGNRETVGNEKGNARGL